MATSTTPTSLPLPPSPSSTPLAHPTPPTTPQKPVRLPCSSSSPSRVPLPSSPRSAKRLSGLPIHGSANRGSAIGLSDQRQGEDEEALTKGEAPIGLRADDDAKESRDGLDEKARYLQLIKALSRAEQQLSEIHSKVYELQEHRHSTKTSLLSPPRPPMSSSPQNLSSSTSEPFLPPSEILLISLNSLLETTSDLLPPLRTQLESLRPQQPSKELDNGRTLSLGDLGSGVGELEYEVVRKRYEDVEDDWNQVVAEVEGAKRELREDRWLDVFRTSAAQAEEMMLSLEKAVAQSQDVMHEVRQLQHLPIPSTSSGPVHSPDAWRNPQAPEPITTAGFEVILKSFEAKRQYYLPSVEKSLSILDKGVRERATKNGETLRRHADMLSRWRRLIDVMERLEKDLVSAHLYLISRDSPHRPKTTSASSSYIPPPQPHYRKVSSSAPSEGSTSTRSSIPGSDVSSLIRQPQNGQQFLATPSSASSSRNRRSSVISNGHGNSSAPNVFQRLLGTLKSGSKPEGSSNSSRSRRESSASPSALDRSYPASASRQTPPSTSSRSHNSTPSSDLSSRRHHPYSITPPSSATTAISSSPSTTASAIPFPSSIPVPSHADTHLSAIRVAKPRWNASPRVPEPPKPSQRPGLERKPSNSALKNGELGGGRPSSRASYGYATSEAGSDYGGGTPSRHQDISRIPRPPRSNNLAPESEADESLDVPSVFLKPHQNSRSFTPNPHQSPRMSLPRSHSASRSLSLIPQLQPGSLSSPSQSHPSLSGLPPSSPSLPTLSSFINGAEDDTDSPLTPPSYFGARSRTFSRSQTPESQLRAKVRDSAFYTPGGLGTPTPATGSSAASAASSDGGSQLRRPRVSMSPSPGPGKTLRPSSIVGPPSAFRGPSPSPNNRSLPSPASSSSPVRPPSRTKTPSSASPASSIPTPSPQRPPSRSTLLTPTSTPARPSSRLSNSGGGDFSTPSRPSSRTQTPSHQQHAIPAGPFQPHPHNSLDLALSALLSSSPYPSQQNLPVSRLNPLPKGAAAGAAEYQTGSFVFGGGVGGRGQKTIQCRLLELNGGRSTSGEGGKVKKVMCRVGGGWLDLEVQLNKLGF